MDSNRYRAQRREGLREPLDRRVDKWIETGRQVVDGVAGNRPGMRRAANSLRSSGSSFRKVGRWVGDKIDWFLEEEDSWLEPWQSESQVSYSGNKRPLEAISLRGSKSTSPSSEDVHESINDDSWPDESSFRVQRWERSSEKENIDSSRSPISRRDSRSSERRPLPRSSRKR